MLNQTKLYNHVGFKVLYLLLLISLPFDGIPYILPSIYRPATVILLIIITPLVGIYILFKDQNYLRKLFQSPYNFIFLFYVLSIVNSLYQSNIRQIPFSGSADFIITLTLGLVIFFVFDFFFYHHAIASESAQHFVNQIFHWLVLIYVPVLVFGLIEVFVSFDILPPQFKTLIVEHTARKAFSRIQLFSGEPSWASMQLLFIIPILMYQLKRTRKLVLPLILITLMLFLINFSLQGFLTLAAALSLLFLVYIRKVNLKLAFLVTISLIILSIASFFIVRSIVGNTYYITRFYKLFEVRSLQALLFIDGSVFVRLFYPIAALIMFMNHPLFGVGGGNYPYAFNVILNKTYPRAIRFSEVRTNVLRRTANSKNLFTRLLGENGLLISPFFFIFISRILKRFKSIKIDQKEILTFWIIMVFANMLQFDSFAYIKLWFMLALVLNLVLAYRLQKQPINQSTAVSVAMVTYNGEQHLREQLDSILIQLRKGDELIVSDGGSNDLTLEILNQYVQNEPRIKIDTHEHLGDDHSFERVVSLCSNPVIIFSNQDNVWYPHKIESTLNLLSDRRIELIMHNADIIDEHGIESGSKLVKSNPCGVLSNLLVSSFWGHCMAFKRSLIENEPNMPSRLKHYDMWLGFLAKRNQSSVFVKESWMKHRLLSNNVSSPFSTKERFYTRLHMIFNYIFYIKDK